MEQSGKKKGDVQQKISGDPNTQHKDYPAQPAPDPGKKTGNKSADTGKKEKKK